MNRYITLLAQASDKASYRKRPVKTLKQVQELAKKSALKSEQEADKKKIKYDESTPKRLAISEAKKKAGKKAFKEAREGSIYNLSLDEKNKLGNLLYMKSVLERRGESTTAIKIGRAHV